LHSIVFDKPTPLSNPTGGPTLYSCKPASVTPFVALLAAIIGGCRGDSPPRIDAPEPAVDSTPAPTAPTLPPSRLDVPVSVDLSSVIEDLENEVPRTFGDIDARSPLGSNDRAEVAWEAERTAFQAELEGDTARLTTLIRYRARVWYDAPVAPELSASCGTADDHDDRPAALVSVSSRLHIDRNWVLRSKLAVDTIRPASDGPENDCRITVLRIDVTSQLMAAASKLLETEAPAIDRTVASIDVRSRFDEWWQLIRTPIALSDSVWLLIDPIGVRRGTVTGQRHTLRATVGLTATPRIVVGNRPPEPTRPLPPLEDGTVDAGLHILIEGVIEYPAISQFLNDRLAGSAFTRAGRSIAITNLELAGIGNGRLALHADFDGDATGDIYFVGTPVYDPVSGLVSVPDLDFDVATSSLLVESVDWLGHEEFVAWIRDRARWPVDDAVAEGRRLLHEGLNRDLSPTVSLTGEVQSVVPLAVLPEMDALRVQAHARATARLRAR
jgi:hypothetical protein